MSARNIGNDRTRQLPSKQSVKVEAHEPARDESAMREPSPLHSPWKADCQYLYSPLVLQNIPCGPLEAAISLGQVSCKQFLY